MEINIKEVSQVNAMLLVKSGRLNPVLNYILSFVWSVLSTADVFLERGVWLADLEINFVPWWCSVIYSKTNVAAKWNGSLNCSYGELIPYHWIVYRRWTGVRPIEKQLIISHYPSIILKTAELCGNYLVSPESCIWTITYGATITVSTQPRAPATWLELIEIWDRGFDSR
jgi:hypothetical protein